MNDPAHGLKRRWLFSALAFAAWFLLGFLDLWSGFVSYSLPRLILLAVLALALLPFDLPPALYNLLTSFTQRRRLGYLLLLGLVALGYSIFLARYLRGANMADDFIFQRVIQNTANGCFFCYSAPGGTYFGNHNFLFLVAFVPFTLFPFWWPLVHLINSVAIVVWCRVCGLALGGYSALGWMATIALFLATYSQHASFYDTRFAELGLAVFVIGFYLLNTRVMWAGALTALPTRETTSLILMIFGLLGIFRKPIRKTLLVIGLLGLVWFVASYRLMSTLGRAPALMRFNPCINPWQSLPEPSCLLSSVSTDWQLKLAYTLRLLRYTPTLDVVPSLIAIAPDLGLMWLSQEDVLYSLNWHYYIMTLGILIVSAGVTARARFSPRYSHNLMMRWVIATGLWQFATMVRPNLF